MILIILFKHYLNNFCLVELDYDYMLMGPEIMLSPAVMESDGAQPGNQGLIEPKRTRHNFAETFLWESLDIGYLNLVCPQPRMCPTLGFSYTLTVSFFPICFRCLTCFLEISFIFLSHVYLSFTGSTINHFTQLGWNGKRGRGKSSGVWDIRDVT